MKTNKYMQSIIALLIFTTLMTSASATNVYSFEAKTTGTYTISGDYKNFAGRLGEMGYHVAELRAGLTREALSTLKADILIIPNLDSDLSPEEMAAIYQFAMDDGKGVFIIGGTPSANKITTPMGMMIVDDPLEDDLNQVIDKTSGTRIQEKTTFSIDLPATRPDLVVSTLTKGVNTVNVFGANGIYIFGSAKGVVLASDNANSPKLLSFPKGSNPPIAAYVKLGKGTVFFISDPDFLVDKNIDSAKYRGDNLKLATNAIDWLSTPSTDGLPTDTMEDIIRSKTVENTNLNRTIGSMAADEENLNTQISTLQSSNTQIQSQLSSCQNTKLMGFDYIIWAVILVGVIISISLFFAMKKKKDAGKKSGKNGGELGYEFDSKNASSGEFSETDAKIGGEVKEEDIEERLKELEKKSSEQQA